MSKLGIIGAGSMASAIIDGVLTSNIYEKADILASAKTQGTAQRIAERFGIETTQDNAQMEKCDVVILAVKPQVLDEIAHEIAPYVQNALVISIAAGKTLAWLQEHIGTTRIVRFMPNLPASVGEGMTAVACAAQLPDDDKTHAFAIAQSFGKAREISEDLFDVATAVAGSSPAFVFMFIDALAKGAIAEGMPTDIAYDFAKQAVVGSALLAQASERTPDELKVAVCSPGGTTIEGVSVLENNDFADIINKAIAATTEKSRRL